MSDSIRESRRRWLKILLGSGVLGAGGLAYYQYILNKPAPIRQGVNALQGSLKINGKAAAIGDPLKPGDQIATGGDSYAQVVVGEHAFLVRANTEANFFTSGVTGQVLTLVSGAILSVFGKGDMQLATPFASIGIRGTAAYMETLEDRNYVCICYGQADLRSRQSGQLLESVKTEHHDSPRYIFPDGNRIEQAPLFNHTDMELKLLETLVGRDVPFKMEEY